MEEVYSVAISCRNEMGWVEYNPADQSIGVFIGDEKAKEDAMEFLSKTHEINLPQGSLRVFKPEVIDPKKDVRSFQIALTRLWEATEVHVDWSRPVDYVKEHPRLDQKEGQPSFFMEYNKT